MQSFIKIILGVLLTSFFTSSLSATLILDQLGPDKLVSNEAKEEKGDSRPASKFAQELTAKFESALAQNFQYSSEQNSDFINAVRIDAKTLHEGMEEASIIGPQYVLVDTRGKNEMEVSVLPGSISMENFSEYKDQIIKDQVPVVFYCTVGKRAAEAAANFSEEGGTGLVFNGVFDWAMAGYPFSDSEGLYEQSVHFFSESVASDLEKSLVEAKGKDHAYHIYWKGNEPVIPSFEEIMEDNSPYEFLLAPGNLSFAKNVRLDENKQGEGYWLHDSISKSFLTKELNVSDKEVPLLEKTLKLANDKKAMVHISEYLTGGLQIPIINLDPASIHFRISGSDQGNRSEYEITRVVGRSNIEVWSGDVFVGTTCHNCNTSEMRGMIYYFNKLLTNAINNGFKEVEVNLRKPTPLIISAAVNLEIDPRKVGFAPFYFEGQEDVPGGIQVYELTRTPVPLESFETKVSLVGRGDLDKIMYSMHRMHFLPEFTGKGWEVSIPMLSLKQMQKRKLVKGGIAVMDGLQYLNIFGHKQRKPTVNRLMRSLIETIAVAIRSEKMLTVNYDLDIEVDPILNPHVAQELKGQIMYGMSQAAITQALQQTAVDQKEGESLEVDLNSVLESAKEEFKAPSNEELADMILMTAMRIKKPEISRLVPMQMILSVSDVEIPKEEAKAQAAPTKEESEQAEQKSSKEESK